MSIENNDLIYFDKKGIENGMLRKRAKIFLVALEIVFSETYLSCRNGTKKKPVSDIPVPFV